MEQSNLLVLAEAVDKAREMVNALVAGLKADGFTDREARAITARFLSLPAEPTKTDEEK